MASLLKPFLLLVILFSTFSFAAAQFTKSIALKPIYKEGWRYFYDTKKVNSAYSLQIPLEGVNIQEVNRYFNSFKTFQYLRGIAYIPTLIFLFTSNVNSQQDANTFTYLLAGSIACDLLFSSISHHKMQKAIDLYNIAIAPRSSLGLQLEKIKTNQTLISFGFRQRF